MLIASAGSTSRRFFKGANSDLSVLQSTKFELVINLKTAKALGLKNRKRSCYGPTSNRIRFFCLCRLMALSGLAEMVCKLSALRGEADMRDRVTSTSSVAIDPKEIIAMAARHRLPVVYAFPFFAREGGLISYGVDLPDQYRQAASYADRILRGEKPADLPVQQPTKFALVVNLATAKALGLKIPEVLLLRADEVIE
jgi:ABC transporter substrate binding protein